MSVLRLGYVHLAVTDMPSAHNHYTGVVGLAESAETPERLYLKGWDEWDHHSLVLEQGDGGLLAMGWKVRDNDSLAQVEKAAHRFGATVRRLSDGERTAVGDGFRCTLPSGHVAEFYSEIETVGTAVGTLNPDPWPRAGLPGIGAPRLSHLALSAEDVAGMERFMVDVCGFHVTERIVADPGDADPIASFLSCGEQAHDIAVQKGEDGRLHHIAYQVESWNAVLHAADVLSMNDVPIDIGPTRHGITRGETVYFFDPTGNRNEVFAGGYRSGPDMPCITWTADQIARAIFYHDRRMSEQFLTAQT
ncbi:catechol 2,3-dioxygenase [Nocardia sp. R7R-8]|uniref:catechol 2,3-dioxygenase n=1 Tax=Nocardia sp. R7R-8 TaxID=3459304 RepID=UPI00403DABD2